MTCTAFTTALPLTLTPSPKRIHKRHPRSLKMAATTDQTITQYYPPSTRSRAPFITISPDRNSLRLEMKPVETFVNQADDKGTLFDYDDREFKASKVESVGAAWPSGDGRRVEMKGTMGSFTQPNLRTYGPFPDFFKRSCEL
eukprot:Plantae.Rhodophyta-Hildenbrandia_rubra.ctg11379.p1 GENE.Plantae.Rhodophyta-Hildenbrandia_rubra.ctg11379~~Plantae.Rhodophyta-Hildenbrandia_rubra.ctg11379.p1  ORF type:complete len:142 (+),score=4.24 Plantae.Rhodophyta-Hildenbrandia_rubra.ctg11379:256-681(+)